MSRKKKLDWITNEDWTWREKIKEMDKDQVVKRLKRIREREIMWLLMLLVVGIVAIVAVSENFNMTLNKYEHAKTLQAISDELCERDFGERAVQVNVYPRDVVVTCQSQIITFGR